MFSFSFEEIVQNLKFCCYDVSYQKVFYGISNSHDMVSEIGLKIGYTGQIKYTVNTKNGTKLIENIMIIISQTIPHFVTLVASKMSFFFTSSDTNSSTLAWIFCR